MIRVHQASPAAARQTVQRRSDTLEHRGHIATPKPRANGFTLLETTMALAVLGTALLLLIAVSFEVRRALERLDARREALFHLEMAHETLRAGEVRLESGPLLGLPAPGNRPPPQVEIEVIDSGPRLQRVVLRSLYSVHGNPHELALETLVYRP